MDMEVASLLCDRELIMFWDRSGELVQLTAQLNQFTASGSEECPDELPPQNNDSFTSWGTAASESANMGRVFRFRPRFDLMEMANCSAHLATTLQNHPEEAKKAMENIVFEFAKYAGFDEISSVKQVKVLPIFTNLCFVDEYETKDSASLLHSAVGGHALRTVHGQVLAKSSRIKYISSTAYTCGNIECGLSVEDVKYVKLRGLVDNQTTTVRQECHMCGQYLQEQFSRRDVSTRVLGSILPLYSGNLKTGNYSRSQALNIVLSEEEALHLNCGQNYEFVYQPVMERRGQSFRVLLEIISVSPLLDPSKRLVSCGEIVVPQSIYRIYQDRLDSPWSFGLSLAFLTAAKFTPPGYLWKLKLVLLLSCVSSETNRLHICASDNDTELIDRVMRECQCLVGERTSHVSEFKFDSEEATSVMRTIGTVSYLGDLSTYKPKFLEEVKAMIDSNSWRSKNTPSQCPHSAVWSYVRTPRQGKSKLSEVINTFDLFVRSPDVGWDDSMATFVLERSLGFSPTYDAVLPEHLAFFLKQVQHVTTKIMPEAFAILNGYFQAARRMAIIGLENGFSRSMLQTLLKMADSYAKLSMRTEVTEDDSVMACYLYEEFLASGHGVSFMNVVPNPHATSKRLSELLGKQNDRNMRNFKQRLDLFSRGGNCGMWEE